MALYDYSKTTGLTIPDTLDIREAIREKFKAAFGANVDVTEETHLGRFIDEVTELVVQTTGVNAQNANQFNINYATGEWLDNIGAANTGSDRDLSRQKASQTKVNVTLTCSASGTVVPAKTRFETDDGFLFQLKNAVTCSTASGSKFTGAGEAEAVESGAIYVLADTSWAIKTPVAGLESISNSAAQTEVGSELETDDSYRARLITALGGKNSDEDAIRDALLALTDSSGNQLLSSVRVRENGWPYPVKMDGIFLPAHAIYVCVKGVVGSDGAIASAIFNAKSAGCGYTTTTVLPEMTAAGSGYMVNQTVSSYTLGYSQVVTFFRPVERGIKITLTVDSSNYTGTDLKSDITSAIQSYLSAEGIGASVVPLEFITAINKTMGGTVEIKSVALQYGGADATSASLSIGECFSTETGLASAGKLEIVVS